MVLGSWINTASPVAAELMARSGFDFLTVDAEHSPVDLPQAHALFQAIRSGNPDCAPLVRLAGNVYAETKRYLDAGAEGVIAPFINTPEQAMELVQAVKFPPEGRRGVGFCRANDYGLCLNDSVERANFQTFVCVQIEHVDALDRIDDILSVPGVDAAMIGPYDLSASMGITGQFDHPDMKAATGKIVNACLTHTVIPGIHVVQPDAGEAAMRFAEGYRFIAYSLDITMLLKSCIDGVTSIRKVTGDKSS
ncbi:aldolase/citrate lyase family protein [Desulfatiferula olefinivorans]